MLKIDKIIKNKKAHQQVAKFFTLFDEAPAAPIINTLFKLNVGESFSIEEISTKSKLSNKVILRTLTDLDTKWGLVNTYNCGRGKPKKYELNKAKLEVAIEVMYLLKIRAVSY